MNETLPVTTEKKCPRCGTESVAWVTTNPPGTVVTPAGSAGKSDQFECRKCGLLFNHYDVD